MKYAAFFAVVVLCVGLQSLHGQDAPASQPAIIDVSDKDGMAANIGKDVVVEGVVSAAVWSRSGAVMNIDFKDAESTRFLAVLFQRNRETLDKEFAGDIAKALTGARVRIKGKLQEYGGRQESFKGRPQIIINGGFQITIVEPAASQPA